jgi:outer membrane protein assembly factor BamA
MAHKRANLIPMTPLTPIRLSVLVCLCRLTMAQAQQEPVRPASKLIEAIEFRGLNHVTQEMMKAATLSKTGDVYDQAALRRDFTALWKTGRFTDIQVVTDPGAHSGVIVRFVVTERQDRPQAALASDVIEGVEFRGISDVTQDAMKAAILSKTGDVYDEAALRRDVTALWKTNRFDDVQVKTETGTRGGIIVRFVVTEWP